MLSEPYSARFRLIVVGWGCNPKGPKIEKIQDLEIFKRDWKFQASHPPNPYFFWWGILEVRIETFKRDWKFQVRLIFSIFGPLGNADPFGSATGSLAEAPLFWVTFLLRRVAEPLKTPLLQNLFLKKKEKRYSSESSRGEPLKFKEFGLTRLTPTPRIF